MKSDQRPLLSRRICSLHPHSPILLCQLLSFSTAFPLYLSQRSHNQTAVTHFGSRGDAHPHGWSKVASQRDPLLILFAIAVISTMWVTARSISGYIVSGLLYNRANIRRGSSSTSSPSSSFDLNNVYQQRHQCSHPESGKIR